MKFKRMSTSKRTQLSTAALLIRFRTAQPSFKPRKYATYRQIAQTLNLTVYEV